MEARLKFLRPPGSAVRTSQMQTPLLGHQSAFHDLWAQQEAEDDDWLHNPQPNDSNETERGFGGISWRGFSNVVTLLLVVAAVLIVYLSYPVNFAVTTKAMSREGDEKLGRVNGTGQVPDLPLSRLIDPDTPQAAHHWTKPQDDGARFHLVFSDEFEKEGRTFWPGDDPFWEAVDIHYAATFDYEWYSPEAVNTSGGFLNIVMDEMQTHQLNFRSGMVQSWNKFCMQGGYVEGNHSTQGFWPGVWLMGNLGRPGYLATTKGFWPYSYDGCDTGILPNQTWLNKTGPRETLAVQSNWGTALSYLDGMRTPSCTCPGEDHPGPDVHVGRAAPELDIVEMQMMAGVPVASQSLQTAPFDLYYQWRKDGDASKLQHEGSRYNAYQGGPYQEALSGLTNLSGDPFNQIGQPVTVAVEWEPDWTKDGSGYVHWYVGGRPTWLLMGAALGPQPSIEIGQRLIPVEPMSLVVNLGISSGFLDIMWNTLDFPTSLKVDYIRAYQRDGRPDRISCDPPDYPTAKYIEDHWDLYMNPNLTELPRDKYRWPRNRLTHNCTTGARL